MSPHSEVIETVLEAYRGREIAPLAGGFSLSQQNNFSCSQMLSQSHGSRVWITQSCRDLVETIPASELHMLIREVQESDMHDLLKALQQIFPCKTDVGASSWLAIIQVCIQDLTLASGRKGRELMDFILNQVDHFEGQACVDLIEGLLSSIGPDFDENNTKSLELLPKLIERASQLKAVKISDTKKNLRRPPECSGSEYLDHFLSELCRREWPSILVVPLITTIRDLHLTENQLFGFVRKIAREASRLELQQLPPLVYQILLLSSQGHRVRFLTDVFQLFNDLDEKCEWNAGKGKVGEIVEAGMSEEELVHVEGTVIQYFSFAVKQDPTLGFDILKLLKNRQFQLSPFEVALLLNLYKVQRYESKVFEILKKAVECEYTHDFQRSVSPWIESLQDLVPPTSMSNVMKSVLRRSGKGWEHIMAGFIGFALNLVLIFSKKSNAAKGSHQGDSQGYSASFASCSLASNTASKGISTHVVFFSLQLLERAFRKHESVRNEILGNIFSGVTSRDESSPHYVQLLSRIATACCHDVMECISKVKDTLEYISFMSPGTAVNLVRALQPVLHTQTSLQDFLHIVLRKSLFNRELDARLVALECLIFIAETSCPPSTQVHSSSSQQADSISLKAVDSTAIEIISQIRRCMSQQVQLRQKLYDGLLDLLHKKPYLANHILGILLPQLAAYIIKDCDGAITQLNLQSCVDELGVGISEPIAHLLRAIVYALVVSEGEEVHDDRASCSNIVTARAIMEKVATFITETELADFELDRLTDFEKPHLLHVAKLLSGIYEAVLEYMVVLKPKTSPTWTKDFFSLVEKTTALHDLLKVPSKPSKGRKSSAHPNDEKTTLLTHRFSAAMLSVVGERVPDDIPFDRATCTKIFEDVRCMGIVLQTAIKQIHQLRVALETAGQNVMYQATKDLKLLIPLIFRQYLANSGLDRALPVPSSTKKNSTSGKTLALLAFEALELSLTLLSTKFGLEVAAEIADAFLEEIRLVAPESKEVVACGSQGDGASQTDSNAKISKCIGRLQQEFDKFEGQAEYDQARQILCILHPFMNMLPNDILVDHLSWIREKCKTLQGALVSIPGVTKILVSAYLRCTLSEGKLKSCKMLSNDVRNRLGLAEGEEGSQELGDCVHQIVNDESIYTITSTVVDALKGSCDEVEWVLSYLDQSFRQDIFEDGESADLPENIAALRAYRNVDDLCIIRLNSIFDVLRILSTSDLEASQPSHEAILSGISRIYKAAEVVSKRLVAAKGKPSKAFTALIQGIGTKMNDSMYSAVFRYMKAQENASTRAQINKEQKLIPTLIFHVESLEANLIKISTLSKVDLMRNFKRSAARDFKIDFAAVTSKLSEEASGCEKKRKSKKEGDKGKKRAAEDDSTQGSIQKPKKCRKKAGKAEQGEDMDP